MDDPTRRALVRQAQQLVSAGDTGAACRLVESHSQRDDDEALRRWLGVFLVEHGEHARLERFCRNRSNTVPTSCQPRLPDPDPDPANGVSTMPWRSTTTSPPPSAGAQAGAHHQPAERGRTSLRGGAPQQQRTCSRLRRVLPPALHRRDERRANAQVRIRQCRAVQHQAGRRVTSSRPVHATSRRPLARRALRASAPSVSTRSPWPTDDVLHDAPRTRAWFLSGYFKRHDNPQIVGGGEWREHNGPSLLDAVEHLAEFGPTDAQARQLAILHPTLRDAYRNDYRPSRAQPPNLLRRRSPLQPRYCAPVGGHTARPGHRRARDDVPPAARAGAHGSGISVALRPARHPGHAATATSRRLTLAVASRRRRDPGADRRPNRVDVELHRRAREQFLTRFGRLAEGVSAEKR